MPQAGNYTASAPSGALAVYGGRAAPVLAWLAAIAPGTFGTIAGGVGQRLVDVITTQDADALAAEGNVALVTAWNGAAYLPDLHRYIIGPAGGHLARFGNDVFAIDLDDADPSWFEYRTHGPASGGTEGHNTDGDFSNGEPRAPHNYNHIIGAGSHLWITGVDAMAGGVGYTTALHYRLPADKARGDKTAVFEKMSNPLPTTGMDGFRRWIGGGAAYDAATGFIYACDQYGFDAPTTERRFVRTNAATGAQLLFNSPAAETGYNWVAIADELRLLMVGSYTSGGALHRLWYANLDTEVNAGTQTITWHNATLSGTPEITGMGQQAHYHHASRALFCWNGDGASLRKCAIPATLTDPWLQSSVAAAPGNTVTPTQEVFENGESRGTFGRWQIARDVAGSGIDVGLLINAIDQPIYVYRFPAEGV